MRVVPIDKSTDRRQYMKDYYKILGVDRQASTEQMLMCDKVTHKKLIDSNLLFRKISRNLLSKMIQYNSKKIFF